jgi:hypothetical protein
MTDRDPLFQVLNGFTRAQLRLLQQRKFAAQQLAEQNAITCETDSNSRDIAAPPGAQPGLIQPELKIEGPKR